MQRLFSTTNDFTDLIPRIALGAIMLPHGLQKTVGWFGGHGFEGTMGFLTGSMGLPWIVAFTVIFAESAGALALIFGALGRVQAALIGAVMVGATVTMHWQHGFFMDWNGTQAGQGFEYHLLALALVALTVIRGSGPLSVDAWVAGKLGATETQQPKLRAAA